MEEQRGGLFSSKKGKDKKGGGDAAGGELDDKAVAKMWELTSQSLQLQLGEYITLLTLVSSMITNN